MTSPAPFNAYFDNVTIMNLEGDVSSENIYRTSDRPLSLILELVFNFIEPPRSKSGSRPYKAHWELKDGKLYLIDLVGSIINDKLTVHSLFPNEVNKNDSNPKVFAHWYSGEINITMDYKFKKIADKYFDCTIDRIYRIDKGLLLNFSENYEESETLPF